MRYYILTLIMRTVFIGIGSAIILLLTHPIYHSMSSNVKEPDEIVNVPHPSRSVFQQVRDTVYIHLPAEERPVTQKISNTQEVNPHFTLYQISAWYLKSYEGLFLYPYKCSGGVWTIGWGNVIQSNEFGTQITGGKSRSQLDALWDQTSGDQMSRVRQFKSKIGGNTITRDQANDFFVSSFSQYRQEAKKYTDNPHQEFALAMFAYNVGWAKLRSNQTQAGQALASRDWVKLSSVMKRYVNSNGHRLQGLVKRRSFESKLLLGQSPSNKQIQAVRDKVIQDIQNAV